MRVAFAGNPNSGKTTVFNALTGLKGKVGNWGGVTVGRKEGALKPEFAQGDDVTIIDLPGAYSMSPFSPEEAITSEFVRTAQPDVIVNVVDATNLNRSLFFTTQLLELGIPTVIALNKSDVAQQENIVIDAPALAKQLGCPVVQTVGTAREGSGLEDLVRCVYARSKESQHIPYRQSNIDMRDKAAVDAEDRKRYEFANSVVEKVESRHSSSKAQPIHDRLDRVLTNPVVGILIFAAVMWVVFALSQTYVGPYIADWVVGWIETFQSWVAEKMVDSPPLLTTIIADGIIGGVGAVIGFLPLVMVMYFFLALLEESGYMARVSAVLDPIFKRVGLSGKSVIPIVIGTGCSIPAIMSSRTIRNERERRATVMLTSYIPCGAKIPVIALFSGAFFSGAVWVTWVSYLMGLVLIFLGALLVKAVTGYKYRQSFFIMEFPRYKVPSLRGAVVSMLERAKAYIVNAATIILICNLVVQVMQSFTWNGSVVPEGMEDTSILASIASPVAFLLIPLGFGTWQLAAAAVTGFIAKENVVGTIAVVYGLTAFINTDELTMTGGANEISTAMGLTGVTALAYLFFNLFTPPCFAAIGAMNSEMQHKGWLLSAISLQFCTGFTVAFVVYQVGTVITQGHVGRGFLPGAIVIALMAVGIIVMARVIRAGFAQKYDLRVPAQPVA